MTLWDELIKMRDEQRADLKGARALVRYDDLPWETNPQGKMRWYMHPAIKDTAHRELLCYVQDIPPGSRSGKLLHQGGATFYVWKGKGYSIINDVRYDWEEEDVILLPISVEWDKGVTYQHFNGDKDNNVLLIYSRPNAYHALGVDLGIGMEQLEDCPEYSAS